MRACIMLALLATSARAFSMLARPPNIMAEVQRGCDKIVKRYGSGYTEAFYQRMLQLHFYELGIPSMAEVDCFVLAPDRTPVVVGRIDLEIDHSTILELKVAPAVTPTHLLQLRKYVKARREMGMAIENAALVCFTDRESVIIKPI